MKCRHCGRYDRHWCSVVNRAVSPVENVDDFIISAVVAAATDSAIIGGLVGGDFVGGVVGDLLDGDLFD